MSNLCKRTVSLLFILIIADYAIAALNPKATGYDISIYYSFPDYFWILLSLTYLTALVVMLQNIKSVVAKSWWFGYCGFISVNLLIGLLPLFRGYYFYGLTDPGFHVGWAKLIILTGHFFGPNSPLFLNGQTILQDIYPASHILLASLTMITGASLLPTAMLIPSIFLAVYAFAFYFCAEKFVNSKSAARIIAMFGLPLLLYYQSIFLPEIFTFELLPVCFLVFLLGDGLKPRALLSLLLIAAVFYHPFDALMILGILSIINYGLYLMRNKSSSSIRYIPGITNTNRPNYHSWSFLIAPVFVWVTWFGASAFFSYGMREALGLQSGYSQLQIYYGFLQNVGASVFVGLEIIGFQLFQDIVLVIGAVVVIVLFFKVNRFNDPSYRGLLLVFPVLLLVTIAGVASPVEIDYRRTLTYTAFIAELILGIGFYSAISSSSTIFRRRTILAILCTFLFVVSTVGIFNFNQSPLMRSHNDQMTFSEIDGMTEFLGHENTNYQIYNPYGGSGMYQYVDAALIYGLANLPSNIAVGTSSNSVPWHYGYNKYPYFGDTSAQPFYFISNSFAVIAPSVLIPQYKSSWAFTPQDWDRLESHDPTANLVINSGGFFLFYVSPPES